MDPAVKQLIANTITSAVTAAIKAIQAKHEEEILVLREIIEKSLLLRESLSAILPPDPDATPKANPGANSLPKITTERWN